MSLRSCANFLCHLQPAVIRPKERLIRRSLGSPYNLAFLSFLVLIAVTDFYGPRASALAEDRPAAVPSANADAVHRVKRIKYTDLAGGRVYYGPVELELLGINPLRFPNTTILANNQIILGPNSVLSSTAGAISTPLPIPGPSVATFATPLPVMIPKFDVNGISSVGIGAPCAVQFTTTTQIDSCSRTVLGELHALLGAVGSNSEILSLSKSTALAEIGDDGDLAKLLETSPVSIVDPCSGKGLPPEGGQFVGEVTILTDCYNTLLTEADQLTSRISSGDENETDLSKDELFSQAATELSRILSVQPWPSALSAQAAQDLRSLQAGAGADFCKTKVKGKDAIAQSCSRAQGIVTAWNGIVTDLGATGARATAYNSQIQELNQISVASLAAARPERFAPNISLSCGGVFSGGKTSTLTIALDSTKVSAVSIVCEPRAFTSYGVAFTKGAEHNFVTTAVPPTPMPTTEATSSINTRHVSDTGTVTATGSPIPVKVVDSSSGLTLPSLVTMEHFQIYRPSSDEYALVSQDNVGAFATVGVGTTTNTAANGLNFDLFGGLSIAAYRSLIFSIGERYGVEQELFPGYSLGQTIVAVPQTTVMTNSIYRFHPFFSVTLGKASQ